MFGGGIIMPGGGINGGGLTICIAGGGRGAKGIGADGNGGIGAVGGGIGVDGGGGRGATGGGIGVVGKLGNGGASLLDFVADEDVADEGGGKGAVGLGGCGGGVGAGILGGVGGAGGGNILLEDGEGSDEEGAETLGGGMTGRGGA